MGGLRKAIAIDFDGCLCSNTWPEIGEPNWPVIEAALAEQKKGTALILWTCRWGTLLDEAVTACAKWGLTFDTVNENLPERLEFYGSESRKISADEYWDDHAVHMPKSPNDPLTLDELMEMNCPVWCRVDCLPNSGYWCLCEKGSIITPALQKYTAENLDFSLWRFYRRRPKREEEKYGVG